MLLLAENVHVDDAGRKNKIAARPQMCVVVGRKSTMLKNVH